MPDQWFDLDGNEAALKAHSLCRTLWDQSSLQRQRCRRQIERYYGASLDPMLWRNKYQIADDLPLVWNLTKSLVKTIESRIGAVAQPKLQFVTSDATWTVRRRGQKLDQFIDALALQDCGKFPTVHALRVNRLRDCCIFGIGWAQVDADYDMGRVLTEPCFSWEVFTDSRDARYGHPTTWVRTCTVSKHSLKAWYPEHKAEIEAARESSDIELEVELGLSQRTTPMHADIVRCFHVWHLAAGPEAPGRHMFLLDDGAVALTDEEWLLDKPPLIPMFWDDPLIGVQTMGLADDIAPMEDEINRNIQRMGDAIRRTGMATHWVQQGTVDKSQLEETRDSTILEYEGSTPPITVNAEPFGQAHIEWINLFYGKTHELTGVSEMAAHGQKEPGITSGVAIRAVSEIQSDRFAVLTHAQENWMILWAELAINAVHMIAEEKKNFEVKWSGGSFLKQLNWKDISLTQDQYVMQIRPVSGNKNEPSDRLQRAEELLGAGMISQQTYLSITQLTLDVHGAADANTNQRELIDCYIERWLDATDEQLQSGMFDEDKQIALVPPPLRWLNMPEAILQVAQAYMKSEIDGAPDNIRQLFIQWLDLAENELQSQDARKQAAARAQQQALSQTNQAGPAQAALQQMGDVLNAGSGPVAPPQG